MQNKIKKTLGAAVLSMAPVFAHAGDTETAQDIQQWYDDIRPLSFVRSPEEQCVPTGNLEASRNPEQQERAERILEVMNKTPLTNQIADNFIQNSGALCFVDLKAEQEGNIGDVITAMHFAHYNTIIINERDDIGEGCQILASIHEMHHATQAYRNITYPIMNLTFAEQQNLGVTLEADAFAVQIIGSEALANAGYTGAKECNSDLAIELEQEHITAGLEALENSTEHGHSSDDGHTITNVYNSIASSPKLFELYGGKAAMFYDCNRFSNCMSQTYTLDDVGIDLNSLATIHYPEGYEVTPFSEFRDNAPAPQF